VLIKCAYCGKEIDKRVADVNRANKEGYSLYCGRGCFGKGRRLDPEEKKRRQAERIKEYWKRPENAKRKRAKGREYGRRTYQAKRKSLEAMEKGIK